MQSFRIARACALAAALVLPFSGPAVAKEPTVWAKATLAAAAAEPVTATAQGVTWTCTGADCVGTIDRRGPDLPFVRECKSVSAALGPLAAFQSRGREATASQLANCNKDAKAE